VDRYENVDRMLQGGGGKGTLRGIKEVKKDQAKATRGKGGGEEEI
jgi:hypothetical protein